MKTAEAVKQLKEKLGNVLVQETEFHGEVTVETRKEHLLDVLSFFKNDPRAGYEVLMDLTAVDYIEPVKRSKIVYWLHNPVSFERVRVALFINRDEKIPSVTGLWEGADWYERELYDMFGVHFEGRPEMRRILMPDDWKGHPLQRDYPLTEEPVEFKHGAKPKIPSEIINIRSKQKL